MIFILKSKLDSYQKTQQAYYQALSENIDHVDGDQVFIKEEKLAFVKSHFEIKSKPKVNEEIRKAAIERFKNRVPNDHVAFNDRLKAEGIQWGDLIASVTKQLGVKQCSGCNARQHIMNEVKKNGWIATIKALKDTFKSE